MTKTNTLPRSALKDHQRLALFAAQTRGITHKISDEARRQQPFDAFQLKGVAGFVVVCFTQNPKIARVYTVDEWKGADRVSPCAFEFFL